MDEQRIKVVRQDVLQLMLESIKTTLQGNISYEQALCIESISKSYQFIYQSYK